MRIVLDLQGCQSPGSRIRGIGRYSMALAQAIARNPNGHEVWIGLNNAFPDTVEAVRGAFDRWIPQERIVVWETVGPVAEADPNNRTRRWLAECLREDFLARLNPDVVHVSTLFEGWADDVTASIGKVGNGGYLTALTLYDLIPLAREQSYLNDTRVKAWYYEKLECLKKADVILAISDFAAKEAVDLLGLPQDHIFNISAANDASFLRLSVSQESLWKTCAHYGIQRPYVMYTGGMDPRKNLDGLVRAYATLPVDVRREHQLVIAGTASPDEMKELRAVIGTLNLLEEEVIFVGYVPDSDLVALYNACKLYVFPSFHEGFGLPALEAMACGAVVIGADATSLPEVIGHPRALFDPASRYSMSECMLRALTDVALREELLQHGKAQVRKFSWESSAERALRAFEVMHSKRHVTVSAALPQPAGRHNPRIAIVPLATAPKDGWSGPALIDMVNELTAAFSVTVLATDDKVRARAAELGVPCQTLPAYEMHVSAFDAVLYEIANAPECARVLGLVSKSRGSFYVHDSDISVPSMLVDPVLLSEIRLADGGYTRVLRCGHPEADGTVGVLPWLRSRATGWVPAFTGHDGNGLGTRQTHAARIVEVLIESVTAGLPSLCRKLMAPVNPRVIGEGDLRKTAAAAALNTVMRPLQKQLLVDISYLVERDTRTGVQRVVYKVLDELLRQAPPGFVVEPVHFDTNGVMYYARKFCWIHLGLSAACPPDDVVEVHANDIFLGLDLAPDFVSRNADMFAWLRNRQVQVHFVVYDLLPLLRPECFDSEVARVFERWAQVVAEVADGALCISGSVADELARWLEASGVRRPRPFRIGYFHLGADLEPGDEISRSEEGSHMTSLESRRTIQFLMVSTVEPRKGHAQTLDAFELLWSQDVDARLVIVGKAGWLVDDLIERITAHAEFGKRLIWIDRADDAKLIELYRTSSALLAASEGEGFGLPLIEAAHYGLPLICRDIPVFREVAGEYASYFDGYDAKPLAEALRNWMSHLAAGAIADSSRLPTLTWAQSAAQLLKALFEERPYVTWTQRGRHWFPAYDRRLSTDVGYLLRGAIHSNGEAGMLVRGAGISVARGDYRIRVLGDLQWDTSGECRFEVRSRASGETIMFEYLRPNTDGAAGVLLDGPLELNYDVRDVEFQVWVSSSVRMEFQGVELHSVDQSVPPARMM